MPIRNPYRTLSLSRLTIHLASLDTTLRPSDLQSIPSTPHTSSYVFSIPQNTSNNAYSHLTPSYKCLKTMRCARSSYSVHSPHHALCLPSPTTQPHQPLCPASNNTAKPHLPHRTVFSFVISHGRVAALHSLLYLDIPPYIPMQESEANRREKKERKKRK
jgi:hypothetical protein